MLSRHLLIVIEAIMKAVCPRFHLSQFLISRRQEQEKIYLLWVDFRSGVRAHVLQAVELLKA